MTVLSASMNRGAIICRSEEEKARILKIADELNVRILEPIVHTPKKYEGITFAGVIIDETQKREE